MKTPLRTLAVGALALSVVARLAAANLPLADVASPEARRVAVELAQHLTRPPEPVPVPADLTHPFNPPGFEQPDPEELRAAAAANPKGPGPAPAAASSPLAHPPGEREILETLAAKLPTTGSIIFNGEPLLLLARNRVKIGDKFTVAFNGQDYELELVAIDRITFTLRYHGEEITRPIKSGKSP